MRREGWGGCTCRLLGGSLEEFPLSHQAPTQRTFSFSTSLEPLTTRMRYQEKLRHALRSTDARHPCVTVHVYPHKQPLCTHVHRCRRTRALLGDTRGAGGSAPPEQPPDTPDFPLLACQYRRTRTGPVAGRRKERQRHHPPSVCARTGLRVCAHVSTRVREVARACASARRRAFVQRVGAARKTVFPWHYSRTPEVQPDS